jgi:hypothetical protein
MQAYLILMVIFVAGGTILHVAKKQSARYFSEWPLRTALTLSVQ